MQKTIFEVVIKETKSGDKTEFYFPLNIVSADFVKGDVFPSEDLKERIVRGVMNTLIKMEGMRYVLDHSPLSVGEKLIINMGKTLEAIKPNCKYEVVSFEERTYSSGSM